MANSKKKPGPKAKRGRKTNDKRDRLKAWNKSKDNDPEYRRLYLQARSLDIPTAGLSKEELREEIEEYQLDN